MKYWISWHHKKEYGAFEIHSAWWFSGEDTICAAIDTDMIPDRFIYLSYDTVPKHIQFRFIEEKDKSFSPFSDRFPKADWMRWDV